METRQEKIRHILNFSSIALEPNSHLQIAAFLKRIVTGDKKWVTNDNVKREWSWSEKVLMYVC